MMVYHKERGHDSAADSTNGVDQLSIYVDILGAVGY